MKKGTKEEKRKAAKKLGIFAMLAFILLTGCFNREQSRTGYKVLIGCDAAGLSGCRGYDILVVDAEMLSPEEITELRQNGNKRIWSYLNIGSLESFRADYASFEAIFLGEYENWEEERWVDVSQKIWQERIVQKGEALVRKGIDGLFLDNADIYYQYPEPAIYEGLLTMLKELRRLDKPLILNGGDVFVSRALKEDALQELVTGVNQEAVFTEIDFTSGAFGRRDDADRQYYQEYLEECGRQGLEVYLLEYGAEGLVEEINQYCRDNGFFYDIAASLELDREK